MSLRERAESLAAGPLRQAADSGADGRVNRPLLRALAEHGLLGEVFRRDGERYLPTSAVALCEIREGLARHCTEAETAFALQGLGAYPILLAGSDETARRWLPEVAAGRAAAGFALTEPDAGSDARALALTAAPDRAGWRLSGTKAYISNAPDADVYSVFARTGEGITAFAVPRDSPGLSGARMDLIAPHAIGTLDFDGVAVAPEQLIGEVGGGWSVAMRTLDLFRPSVGAFAVGMAQAALDAAVAHAATRRAFGQALSSFQGVSHQLADAATRLRAARLLVYDAAAAYDTATDNTATHNAATQNAAAGSTGHVSAMAKLFATETAQVVVDLAVQVHGARALERGHLLEHLYREVRAPRIYEGTSEIQREIIARSLFR